MHNPVIKVEGLSKEYRLGTINSGTLWRDIQSWLAAKTGKEDPNSLIGADPLRKEDIFIALKNLSFEVNEGDRLGIIGLNGAGKSTLLKILSRITSPTSGSVKIRGRLASLLEVGTGFHGELTGRENIYLNGAILGMKKRHIDRKLEEIIDFSGVEQHIDTPVKRYSSGMYVRLAFAVAAYLDSDILIADEVLAVGDSEFQNKALGKMRELSDTQGRTVLFVSHNLNSIRALCNKGLFLRKGEIAAYGSLDDAVLQYTGSLNNGESDWRGEKGDSNLRLTRAALAHKRDDVSGDPVFTKGDPINIIMEYEILRDNVNYVFSLEFFNERGEFICVCSAADNVGDTMHRQMSSVGKHRVSLEVDTSIFAEGRYFVNFDFAIHCVKRIINDEPALFFDIVKRKRTYQESLKRINVISPEWPWRIE